ncbi:MAG: HU family DNA-binding protein [Bacillota bacterium]|nr:HU family DNA-binding protein [Bacillota bacterium]NLP22665.1 HU family DNA-binding protein [Erysipelotrichaceae bacterium]
MSEVINKKALADLLAEEAGMTKKDAATTLDIVFNTITESLSEGKKVDIAGFGKFEVRERAARTGINPRTKEPLEIPASKVTGFKAAKALKDAVNK